MNLSLNFNQSGIRKLLTVHTEGITIVNNGRWIHLNRLGDEFTAVIDPQPGKLSVNARFSKQTGTYNTLLDYSVNYKITNHKIPWRTRTKIKMIFSA
jgi:hypothetical protein